MRSHPRIAVLVAFLVTAAACSGGPSKEEFIAEADAICAAAEERARDLEPPTDEAGFVDFASKLAGISEQSLADLRELEPPDGDEEAVEELFGTIDDANDALVNAIEKRSSGENPAADYQEALEFSEDASDLAQDYGFDRCGTTPGAETHT